MAGSGASSATPPAAISPAMIMPVCPDAMRVQVNPDLPLSPAANCPHRRGPLVCVPGHLQATLAGMTSSTGSNPEDEYPDHDAEDREQPSTPAEIPATNPKQTCLNSARKSRTARTTGTAGTPRAPAPVNGKAELADLAHDAAEHPIVGTSRRMARSACLSSCPESHRPRYQSAVTYAPHADPVITVRDSGQSAVNAARGAARCVSRTR